MIEMNHWDYFEPIDFMSVLVSSEEEIPIFKYIVIAYYNVRWEGFE